MNWIDAVILCSVAVAAVSGAIIGLSGALLNSLATLIAYFMAFILAAPVKNLLQSIFGIVSGFAKMIAPAIPGSSLSYGISISDALVKSSLPDWSKNILGRIVDSGYVVNSTSDLIAYWIANLIIVIVVFILLLIIFGFAVRYLTKAVKISLPKEGFVNQFDRLLGALCYVFLTFFVCIGVLVIFSSLFPQESAVSNPVGFYVFSSFFGGLVYKNFLGVQTIYGSIVRFVVGW